MTNQTPKLTALIVALAATGSTYLYSQPASAAGDSVPAASGATSSAAPNSPPGTNPSSSGDDVVHLEEVTVGARLREEPLQDVPASIATVSGQTVANLNLVSVTELGSIAPGLTFVTDPGRFGSGPAIALRGISTFTQSGAIQDSVGIVLDGIPLSRAKAGSFPDLNDVQQIDVLSGPQGTLFGKNSSAGVINITTKDPTNVFAGDGILDFSTYNDRTVRASVSGPVIDNLLLVRVSIYSKVRDGYIDDVYNNSKWGADEQEGVRAKLVYTPTSADKVKLSLDYLQQKNDAGTEVVRAFLSTTPQYIVNALSPIVGPENDKIDSQSVDSNGQPSGMTQREGGAALQWDHSMGAYTLTAIAGARGWEQHANEGTYSWPTPLNDGNTQYTSTTSQSSFELRLSSPSTDRLTYVGGFFVYGDRLTSSLFDPDPGLLVLSAAGVPSPVRQQRHWNNGATSFNEAAFGEADFALTKQITLTGGLRALREEDGVFINGLPIDPANQRTVVPLGTTTGSTSAGKVIWRSGAKWKLEDDKMLYFSAASGFKGPGFNTVSSLLGNPQQLEPELSTSFEGGLKSQFLDRRLTFNLTGYYATYDNFQTQGFSLAPGTTVAQVLLSNAAKLETRGAEAQLGAYLTNSTYITANAALIDATFASFAGAQCYATQPVGPGECSAAVNGTQDLAGKRLANTPKLAYNVAANHKFKVPGSQWSSFVTANYSWRSSVQWDTLQNPQALEGAYGVLGASLGVESPNGKYSVKIYGKNLTDQFHTEGLLVGQVIYQFLPVDYRRVVGVTAEARF